MIASPCVNLCAYDRAIGHCTGCGRTLDEIARWGNLAEAEKQRIRDQAAQRLARAQRGDRPARSRSGAGQGRAG